MARMLPLDAIRCPGPVPARPVQNHEAGRGTAHEQHGFPGGVLAAQHRAAKDQNERKLRESLIRRPRWCHYDC